MAAVVATLVLASSPQNAAAANRNPNAVCSLSIDAMTVSPGETRTLVGSGFGARRSVAVTFADGATGSATTDDRGVFALTLHVPPARAGDSWRVVAASGETTCSIDSGTAAVPAAQPPEQLSQGALAFLGLPALAAIGGVFLAACALLFLTIGRRRRV